MEMRSKDRKFTPRSSAIWRARAMIGSAEPHLRVMAGLVPATPHHMAGPCPCYRGRRDKPGDDGGVVSVTGEAYFFAALVPGANSPRIFSVCSPSAGTAP